MLTERVSFEARHDHVEEALAVQSVVFAEVEDRRDVWMAELGPDEPLLADPLTLLVTARMLGVDDLHRDGTAQLVIDSCVDVARAAAADHRVEPIAVVEDEAAEIRAGEAKGSAHGALTGRRRRAWPYPSPPSMPAV